MADKNILVRFLTSGDSPEIGEFRAGDKTLLPLKIGLIFITRCMAEELHPARKTKNKEAKKHGGD